MRKIKVEIRADGLPAERWLNIEGCNGLYAISDIGNVKNANGLIMSLRKDKDGYHLINLFRNGKSETLKVHRLVALAFIPNDDISKTEVNHKDENKSNNELSNLEWCDHKYNNRYGSKPLNVAKKKSKPVCQIDSAGNIVKTHKSTRQIERDMGWGHANISACCLGKLKSAYGFLWQYA